MLQRDKSTKLLYESVVQNYGSPYKRMYLHVEYMHV